MVSFKKAVLFFILLMLGLTSLTVAFVNAEEAKYVGVAKCKLCHILQYKSWQSGKHAKAMDTLTGDDANNPKCLECHTTGYGKPQAERADLLGVQCEACHGAGSAYKSIEVMKDREKAIEAGMIIPREETCRSCHNERNPFHKPFNYEERLKSGVHEHKS